MTKRLPLGLAALMAAAFALQGCASKPAAVESPPAADFTVKLAEVKSDVEVQRAPGWSATQVTASARYVRISGAMPEAKGALAFLADETGLRAGTVMLTQTQADAALAEVGRVTKQDVRSMPTVTVAPGNPTRMTGGVSQAENGKEEQAVMIRGMPMRRRSDAVVELAMSSNVSAAKMIRMEVEMQTTFLDGFVEYGDKLVTISPGGEGGNPPPATVRIQKGFYQPIYSTQPVKAEVQMDSGAVVVLRADRAKSDAPDGLADGSGRAIKSVPPETMLVFLTAKVSPTKR